MKIGIAGTGLMGSLLGWQLSRLGYDVTLFDTDLSGQCSAAFAAAGMLSPFAESVIAEEVILKLGMESLTLWPQLIGNTVPAITYQQKGCIVTCHKNDASELSHFIQRLSTKIDSSLIQSLDQDALHKLEPELHLTQGYHLTLEAQIDSRQFLKTIRHYFNQHNITQYQLSVHSVLPRAIITAKQRHDFDFVFDCRGMGGTQYFSDLRAIRGEIVKVHATDVTINRSIRLMHPRYPLYIVPLQNNHYLIGATEIEAEDHSAISLRSCLELLNAAYSIHRGFAEARIIETTTALRPTLIDNSPRIIYQDGLIAINGLYRHGFLIAPALLQECIRLLHTGIKNAIYPQLIKELAHEHSFTGK